MDGRHPTRYPFRPIGPIKIVAHSDSDPMKKPMIELHYNGETKRFSPHHVSSIMLSQETHAIRKIMDPCFVVPAYFTYRQRLSTCNAWVSAGVPEITLVEEPIAAAAAYQFHLKPSRTLQKNVFVFHVGAASLEVSLVALEGERCISMKATSGQTHLGGDDFSNRLLNSLVAEFRMKHKKDVSNDARALRRLSYACERAKRALSSSTHTIIDIDSFYQGLDFCSSISRSRFEELNMDLFQKCMETVKKYYDNVEMDEREGVDVILVGGSSQIPKLQQLLQELFNGKELHRHKHISPDLTVSYGGVILSRKEEAIFVIKELIPFGIGVETIGGIMNLLIPMDKSTISERTVQIFSTISDNQTSMLILLYQGERMRTKYNYLVGTYKVRGIQPAPRGVPRILVSFHVKTSDSVTVRASDLHTGKKLVVVGNVVEIQTKEEIESMVKDAEKRKAEEELRRENLEARNCLERYVYHIRNGIKNDDKVQAILDASEKDKLEKEIEETYEWLTRDLRNTDEYEDKFKELQASWNTITVKLDSIDS